MEHPVWTRQTLAEVSVTVVVGVVLVLFLGVILVRSPWPAGPLLVTATVIGLFLIPLVVLAGVTYAAAARLEPAD